MLRWFLLAALVLAGCGGSDPEAEAVPDSGLAADDAGAGADDAAADALPADAECQPGEWRCQGQRVRTACKPDGHWEWWTEGRSAPDRVCPDGQLCNRGACVPAPADDVTCYPGALLCMRPGGVVICNADGQSSGSLLCPGTCGPEGCSTYHPAPAGAVCIPGETRCAGTPQDGARVERCLQDGSAWSTYQPCDTGYCERSVCVGAPN